MFRAQTRPALSNVLQAVTVISANDIWAVGYSTDSSTFNNFTLSLHWNDTAWSIVPSPVLNDDILFAVDAVASNNVWAVGRSFQEAQTLTIHWIGANWSIVPSPNGIDDNILFGVATVASNDVWAVGAAGSLSTLAEHWHGVEHPLDPGFQPQRDQPGPCTALSHSGLTTFGLLVSISCRLKAAHSIL